MATTDTLTNYISQGKAKRTLQFLRLCAQYLQDPWKTFTTISQPIFVKLILNGFPAVAVDFLQLETPYNQVFPVAKKEGYEFHCFSKYFQVLFYFESTQPCHTTCEWHILYKHINASNCKIHQGTTGTYIWQNHALAQMKIWFHMTYIVIPIRNNASSSFAILKCVFNLKALLDISGEANQRLLPIGCQWSTTRPVKCWTFEGPWTALSWWSCDLVVLFGHFFLPKASRKSKRQLSRLTKFDDHDEGKWEGRRTAYAFIERIHQQIHEETTQNRYVPCTILTHTNLTSHIFSYVIISSHDCPQISKKYTIRSSQNHHVFPPSFRLHRHFRGLHVVLQGPMPWPFAHGLAEADDIPPEATKVLAALGG